MNIKNMNIDEITKAILLAFIIVNDLSLEESIEFIVCDYFKKTGIRNKIQNSKGIHKDNLDTEQLELLKITNNSKLKKLW